MVQPLVSIFCSFYRCIINSAPTWLFSCTVIGFHLDTCVIACQAGARTDWLVVLKPEAH